MRLPRLLGIVRFLLVHSPADSRSFSNSPIARFNAALRLSHCCSGRETALARRLPLSLHRLTTRGSFTVCKEQNIAGLTSQDEADFLERFKINSHGLAFFQSPKSCMTDTGLLRQPIEGALFLSQQFVEPGHNHKRDEFMFTTSDIYCRCEIYFVAGTYKSGRILLQLSFA